MNGRSHAAFILPGGERIAMLYKVKLEAFEGPLDLLLFLIKKSEIDIYDIPISVITQQYLEYIEIIQLLDLEAASDFILMAATLMRIKAQMLLPKPEVEEMDEIEDPRQELVYRLLEYKRFKEVALDLAEKEKEARLTFPRGSYTFEQTIAPDFSEISDVTLFDLVAAFRQIVGAKSAAPVHRIHEINVSLEEQMQLVMNTLREKRQVAFSSLFKKEDDKLVLIVTLIAILELVKQKAIKASQSAVFGEILIEYVNG
ncbi:segregation/condensation protein A [candidate division KSB1 bacterium]|nr:segregation/condensation protein A [candidate division KSB1 bacterium]RQW09461.1 MAG: segregation/condensation protein A [candidate division KSB1 bacterium]